MRDEQMPHESLKRFRVRRDVFGIDSRDDDVRVGDLRRVASVATDDAVDLRADRARIVERVHEVRADVLFEIAAADAEDENGILWPQATDAEPALKNR